MEIAYDKSINIFQLVAYITILDRTHKWDKSVEKWNGIILIMRVFVTSSSTLRHIQPIRPTNS